MTTTERGARTRTRLIEATAEVVRAHGYGGATTRAIAAAAGVSEATIYRHFPDKVELFFAAVVEGHANDLAWILELEARAGTATVAANLVDALRRLAVVGRDLAPLELAILADPELARRRAGSGELPPGPPASLAAYVRREQVLGRVRADVDPERVALVLLATLFGIVAGQVGTGAPTDHALIETAVDAVTRGIDATPS